MPLLLAAFLSIGVLTWLIISIGSSSDDQLISGQVNSQNTQLKRQLSVEMKAVARERTLIILRMFHEKDLFVRDDMLNDILSQGGQMNRAISRFREQHITANQLKAFSDIVLKMHATAPKVIEVTDLLINEQDAQAAQILFTEVLPSQDEIVDLINKLDDAFVLESLFKTNSLLDNLAENRKKIQWLTFTFVLVMLTMLIFVKTRFARREAILQSQRKELRDNNTINQSILNTAPDAILSVNKKGIIQRVNMAATKLTHFKESDLLLNSINKLSLSNDGHDAIFTSSQLLETSEPKEVTVIDKNKKEIPVLLSITDTGTDGALKFTCILHDLRAAKAAQLELTQQKLTMDKHALVSMSDANGVITYVNEKFCEVSGYSEDELVGQTHQIINSDKQPSEYWHNMYSIVSKGDIWHDEVCNKAKDGHLYWVNTTILPLFDHDGKFVGYSSMRTDITVQKKLEDKLRHQATHDSLTKLANRVQYETRLVRYLEKIKTQSGSGAVLFIDLDRFKPVNDSAGHAAGDLLLTNISNILSRHIRNRDTLARFGGDEFAVLLEDCPLEKAEFLAEQMRQEVDDFIFMHENIAFNVSLSIGLAEINATTNDIVTAIAAADNACQIAKKEGRNRVYIATSESHELKEHVETIAWLPKINKALSDNSFVLYAQKIAPIGKWTSHSHYEILIRLKDGDGEVIPPNVFLPPAERYDLMAKIDYWVIKQAFSSIKHGMYYSINLSGQSVSDENLATYIVELQNKYQVNPKSVTFEITETSAIHNLEKTKLFIEKLSKLGYQFSLDDFGSGLSSFGYLKNIPVNFLKIDGSFVKDIDTDKTSYAMVKSINEVGHSMGLKTIAEFVENEAILNKLKEIGVDFSQGYHIHKPRPLFELNKDF